MGAILNVVLPVFLVMGAGFAAARTRLFPPPAVDGLMLFTQSFGVPCVLFSAIATLDLGAVFNPKLLLSYYSGALASFLLALLVIRKVFGRRPGESVAIAFGALFSNSVLLGLPILSRAYGDGPLGPNFAIISIHAPFCYFVGITAMELVRADAQGIGGTAVAIGRAMFRNALMIGLALGFIVNLGHIPYPEVIRSAVEMIAQAALPVALFGLGGILSRYQLRASFGEAGTVSFASLLIHPLVALVLAHFVFGLPPDFVRACVVTASMAPGVNAYLFANLYQRGQAEAASSVLLSTILSIFTSAGWIALIDVLIPPGG
ncbi:MAG: AEC family transporter [Rhodovulum sulfidophilum]|uniref:AEC family transporter n=1 Tax=Rhodovulum sulfidophilum TaxID=35806 RepID=A0A2W5N5Z4_RHOSU|nr:MAG: AEC family transporter [Rhodovulum sulfidophilum]